MKTNYLRFCSAVCFSLMALALLGCADGDGDNTRLKNFKILVDKDSLQVQVSHLADPDHILWETRKGEVFIAAAQGNETIEEYRGTFHLVADQIDALTDQMTIDEVAKKNGVIHITGRLTGEAVSVPYTLTFSEESEHQLGFSVSLADESFNRIFLYYKTNPDEHFFGFGEQFTHIDLKGHAFSIMVTEQGIARGAEPLSSMVELVAKGTSGTPYTSYAAVPHYLTTENRSLFLENDEISVFDLRDPNLVSIKLLGAHLKGRILYGRNPLDLIEAYTAYSGRMQPLPDWINKGAVVGMQGGTEQVNLRLDALKTAGTPIGAFWLQDWVGKRTTSFGSQLWWNWVLNEAHYPGWFDLVDRLNSEGIKVLTYINPFLVDVADESSYSGENLYQEAAENGYLIKDAAGVPYQIENTSFHAGLVDLTNPDARIWYKNVIQENLIGSGASGWMADFGEALPMDCVLYSGESPKTFHNRYPEEWAKLNREAVTEAGLENEIVYFMRSGYTRSPAYTSLFWEGDQMVTWDGNDGLKSAIKGLLSGGISGYSLNHSDIGGYTTIVYPAFNVNYSRSKELLMRWMEMNAFTAVFRTHEGNRPEDNVQFYTDEDTLAQFTKFAQVFAALADYRRQLMTEAQEKGYPIARHPFLQYPLDNNTYGLEYQWMLGSEFMIAPVVEEGATSVALYLPEGKWVHVWTGTVYDVTSTGSFLTVDAPMGEPPVFYRAGSKVGQEFVNRLSQLGFL